MRNEFRKLFLAFLILIFSFALAMPANAKVYTIEHDDELTQLMQLHNQVQQNTNDINNLYSMVSPGNSAYNSYSSWYSGYGYGNICNNLAAVYNSYYIGTGNEAELLSIISYCRSYNYYDSTDNDCNEDEDDCNDNDDEDDCDNNDNDCNNEDDNCNEANCNHHHYDYECSGSHCSDSWDNYWEENNDDCSWGDECYSHNSHNDYTPNECWGAETYEEYLECRNDNLPHYRNDPPPGYFSHDGIIDYGEDAYKSWADLCEEERQGDYYSDWCNERRWWITGTVQND